VFLSSSLGQTKEELGILVVEGTPTVNGGITVSISSRVIGEDIETVERAVTPVSVETIITMVAPKEVDTFKSPKGEVAYKDCACEDDCEKDELARAIDLPLLRCIHKQFGVFSNKVTQK